MGINTDLETTQQISSAAHLIAQISALSSNEHQIKDLNALLIHAKSDVEAIANYLLVRCQKDTTRKTVERDLRKLLCFMSLNELSSLAHVKVNHCAEFQQWLLNPAPELCSGQQSKPPVFTLKDGTINPNWLPFKKPLSHTSANQTVSKVQSLFQFLVNAQYLKGNPWSLLTPLTKATTKEQEENEESTRELPIECIKSVLDFLNQQNDPNSTQRLSIPIKKLALWRWLFHFYLYTGARISSGCQATLDDLYIDRKGFEQLTLTVKGLGIRRIDVPWIKELEVEFLRYRQAMELPLTKVPKAQKRRLVDEPQVREPLFLPLRSKTSTQTSKAMSYNSVHGHIVGLFRATYDFEKSKKDSQLTSWQLTILQDATGHWIRHGTATLLGEYAQDQLGHLSQKQTQEYQTKQLKSRIEKLSSMTKNEENNELLLKLLEASPTEQKRITLKLAKHLLKDDPDFKKELSTLAASH